MRESLKNKCDAFVQCRSVLREQYRQVPRELVALCAQLFFDRAGTFDSETLKACRTLAEQETDVLSPFQGAAKLPFLVALAASEQPEDACGRITGAYERLTEVFPESAYTVLSAIFLADRMPAENTAEYIKRGKFLSVTIKESYPYLTSPACGVLELLLSFSPKSDAAVVEEVYDCHQALIGVFQNTNAVRALAHILALSAQPVAEKCARVEALHAATKQAGKNYGVSYSLPVLGALLPVGDNDALLEDLLAADAYFEAQGGYEPLDRNNPGRRLLQAALTVLHERTEERAISCASIAVIAALLEMQGEAEDQKKRENASKLPYRKPMQGHIKLH